MIVMTMRTHVKLSDIHRNYLELKGTTAVIITTFSIRKMCHKACFHSMSIIALVLLIDFSAVTFKTFWKMKYPFSRY